MKILLTPTEKKIIENLNDPLYTIDFLEEWINRTDTIAINAPAALQIMGAVGYYQAVKKMATYRRMYIYRIVGSEGFYEDREEYTLKYFLEKESALKYLEEYNKNLQNRKDLNYEYGRDDAKYDHSLYKKHKAYLEEGKIEDWERE